MMASDPNPAQGQRFKTLRTVMALMLREMTTTYGRSPGGYIWAILEPVAALALLTFVFSLVLRTPSIGTSFALFYATGYLPFTLFQTLSSKVSKATSFSKSLLAYPRVTYIDAILARFVLNLLTHLLIFYLMMTGIALFLDVRSILDVPSILLSLAMASLLGLGIGVLNCFLMLAFPVWEQFWSILMRPIFLISGIFFTYEDVPAGVRDYMWYNPLMQIIGEMRSGFFPTYAAAYVSVPYIMAIALISLSAGLLLLKRHHRELLTR